MVSLDRLLGMSSETVFIQGIHVDRESDSVGGSYACNAVCMSST